MITIFIPTEFRPPKKGEWIKTDEDNHVQAGHNYASDRQIVEKHTVEVPEGANKLTVQLRGSCNTPPAVHIQLPKKKVKKWCWAVPSTTNKSIIFITEHVTEDEVKHMYGIREWYHKIPETEIEE